MKTFTWEISDNGRLATLWNGPLVRLRRFRFKANGRAVRTCAECAFAVEKTPCDHVLCEGGIFVEYGTRPDTACNPSRLHGGHAFAAARKGVKHA